MQAHHHRAALGGLFGHQRHHRTLMVQIQMVGGLVRQPNIGRLGKHRRHRHPLAFTAGKRADQAVAKMCHIQRFQGGLGAGVVVGTFHLP